MLAQLATVSINAAELTDGLVDAMMVGELERAGYTHDLGVPLPLPIALRLAPARRPASGRAAAPWRKLHVDGLTIHRPPGLMLDSGGLAKGLFADLLAGELADHDAFAIDCAGDLRVGGAMRTIHVASPFGGDRLHRFEIADGAVATSGIGRRSWIDGDGRPAHHLLDPATGTARVHRGRPGHGARPDGGRGRDPRQGRRAERTRGRGAVAATRRRPRLRRRHARESSTDG